MGSFLSFVVLGFASGAVYAVLATGLIGIYKATRVINFAQGAVAMSAIYVYVALVERMPVPAAVLIGVLWAAVLSLVLYVAVLRLLRAASVLAQVVATVGILLTIQAVVLLTFGSNTVRVPAVLPGGSFQVAGISVGSSGVYLAAIAIALAAAVWVYFRFTRVGLATRAGSQNPLGTSLMGYSHDRLAGSAWALSGAISGAIGIAAASTTGLTPTNYALFIVPALAAALVARLQSVGIACAAGLLLGSFQAVLGLLASQPWSPAWVETGSRTALPFVIIVIALFAVGRHIPARGSLDGVRLPDVRIPRMRPWAVAAVLVLGAAMLVATSGAYRFALITSFIFVLLALSLVLLTGFLGQISLAQLALAGVAGFSLSKFTTNLGVPFPLSLVLAALVATVLGVVIGVPALRIRGAQLAVVTLAGGVTIVQVVLENPALTSIGGNPIASPTLFGWDLGIRAGDDLARLEFGFMTLAVVCLVTLAVANVMRGRTGRAFLAVRSNERAAASVGVNVLSAKLIGFGASAFVAGLGGALIGYSREQLSVASFTVLGGLTLVAIAYLGGITSIGGAVAAGFLAPLGVIYVFLQGTLELGGYYQLVAGLGLVVATVLHPQGIAGALQDAYRFFRRYLPTGGRSAPDDITVGRPTTESVEQDMSAPPAVTRR